MSVASIEHHQTFNASYSKTFMKLYENFPVHLLYIPCSCVSAFSVNKPDYTGKALDCPTFHVISLRKKPVIFLHLAALNHLHDNSLSTFPRGI